VYLKQGPLEGKAYLVVDDFGDMRSMIKNMLLSCGVSDISLANNGADAVATMETRRFDVVLCDYNLGQGKDGQQVLEEARHRGLIGLGAVFLMVTAENARDMVMGAVEYEPDSYLTKPFNKDLLKSRLEKLIARKQDLLPVEVALARHDYVGAIRLLDEKIAAKPPNANELRKLKGEICIEAGETALAREVYEAALALRDLPWARLGVGKTLFLEARYEEAQAMFQALVEAHERYTAGYDWLAKTNRCLNQMEAAQQILQQAAEISPKAVLRQQALGEIALHNNDQSVAEAAFANAVKHGRHSVYRHPSNYANLAKVTAQTKQGPAGLKILKQMEREFGRDPNAHFYMATAESVIHETMGNKEAAKQSLERAANLYETLDTSSGAECALEMAKTYGSLGMTDKAVDLMQNTVLNNHSDDALMSEIRTTMESMGVHQDALASIDTLRQEVASLNNKGVGLARQGRLSEAIDLLEKTAERMPANKVVNLNAALVLLMELEHKTVNAESIGRIEHYLDRVRRAEPGNKTLNKLQNRLESMMKAASLET
jgi:CheY-like chemotaxis protein/predicted negative regulator of RcsB-dependent stress response